MVSDPAAVAAVTDGPDGAFSGLAGGKTMINMSTVSPEFTKSLADKCLIAGINFLDCPVSGSKPLAESGNLVILAAGKEECVQKNAELLKAMGIAIIYAGEAPNATYLKLCVNLVMAEFKAAIEKFLNEGLSAPKAPPPTSDERWQLIGRISAECQKITHKHANLVEKLQDLTSRQSTGLPFAAIILFISFLAIRFTGETLINYVLDPLFQNYWLPLVHTIISPLQDGSFLKTMLWGSTPDPMDSFGLLVTAVHIPLVTVLPYILAFYTILGLLEDSGYLPRLAVLLDSFMHKIGLHGYSVIPLILGFGCKVPAIISTRVLETKREQIIATALALSIAPCMLVIWDHGWGWIDPKKESVKDISRSISHDFVSGNYISTLDLGKIFRYAGKVDAYASMACFMGVADRAEEFLQKALQADPGSFRVNYETGRFYEKEGRKSGAKYYYRKSLAIAESAGTAVSGDAALAAAAVARLERQRGESDKTGGRGGYRRKTTDTACVSRFKEAVNGEKYTEAAEIGAKCRRTVTRNPGFTEMYADVLVSAGKYEDAVYEYEQAAEMYEGAGEKYSGLYVKAAQTLMKTENYAEAEKQLRLAAGADPEDTGILTTLADFLKSRNKNKEALRIYDQILKISPGDTKAKTNAEEIRVSLMSNAEILAELKMRKAVPEQTAILQLSDIKLHKDMRDAEMRDAVGFVKDKYTVTLGYFIEQETPEGIRIMLTGAGYRAYLAATTKEAIRFFEKKGINLREVFRLRDKTGAAVFEKNGQITPEGIQVWLAGQKGVSEWIFSYQPIPGSAMQIQASKDLKDLAAKGYREISEPEYLWLSGATNCPEDILTKYPLELKKIDDGARIHYMMCYMLNSICSNKINIGLIQYIERYRSGDTSVSNGKSTAFFGTGAVRQYRFCENGKIWTGD